jgi:hypothetical protein
MKRFKYSVACLMVLALALVFIGCSKPPEEEQKAAKAAMDAAVSAGADKYAAADLDTAKKSLDTAEAQMKDKKYKEAKEGYGAAKVAFEKAAGAVAAGKKAVADEATAAIATLEQGWAAIEADAKKAEKKMKDKKGEWEADAKAFADKLKEAKDAIPADPLGAKAKAAELKATIEKWDAAFKEMLAAPAKPEPKKAPPAKAGRSVHISSPVPLRDERSNYLDTSTEFPYTHRTETTLHHIIRSIGSRNESNEGRRLPPFHGIDHRGTSGTRAWGGVRPGQGIEHRLLRVRSLTHRKRPPCRWDDPRPRGERSRRRLGQ